MTEPAPEASQLTGVLYVSSASGPMTTASLAGLLAVSRDCNRAAGVSGLLLYRSGNFMQYLEGPPDAIAQTKARIYRDPRHNGIITIAELTVSKRRFANWAMGFADCDHPSVRAMDGYSRFLDECFRNKPAPGGADYALRMLEHFRDNMR